MTKNYPAVALLLVALNTTSFGASNNDIVDQCPLTQPHTTLNFSNYRAHIIEPDIQEKPELWQGPLCIENLETKRMCIQDLSIIKEVKQSKTLNAFTVWIVDGSNAEMVYLNADDCKIIKREAFEPH